MSASERLKALKGRTYRTVPVPEAEQSVVVHEDRLWAALPQIVALVEAAEDLVGVSETLDERVAELKEALS